ncbi:unnamed protein product [Urochloa humidicola]
MRWTRYVQSTAGGALPVSVEIDIRGIPAHAWEFCTAEVLLDDHCWIGGLHPDTADRRDVFTVRAWCSDPTSIPSEMELEIVEPAIGDDDPEQGRRTVIYPIVISVLAAIPAIDPAAPPSPPPSDDERRRRRRRGQSSPGFPLAPDSLPQARVPVHARLGPLP